jgi:ergothioneine biosynthesis protein EgtB
VFIGDCQVAGRPATNADYAEFIADGGYRRPELWLSDGWAASRRESWEAPLYWERDGGASGAWLEYGWTGLRPLDPAQPVRHVSYYEADAFARWRGARLPTEAEWEAAAGSLGGRGRNWEWTASAYLPYPGYRPYPGALSEYNGKFMIDQMVLRGGSEATPPGHLRPTYRNFFPAATRWQFAGIRLARDP